MDYEKSIISRLLFSGEIKDVLDRKVTVDMLTDVSNKAVFSFIITYYNKYGELPTLEVIEREYPDYKVFFVKEPINYCIDKVAEQYIRNKGSDILLSNTKNLIANPLGGLEGFRTAFNKLHLETNPTDDVNFIESAKSRKEKYLASKELKGMDGYSTPWQPLNEATMGWHSEEFIVVVSRMSVGKSWLLTILGQHSWADGLSVLLVSNEMAKEQIERRLDAVHFKLPYQELRAGLLADHLEERYFSGLEEIANSGRNPIWTVGDVGGVSMIGAKIDEYKPDIVLIDGIYLLQDDRRGGNKWERTSNVSWDLKKLCKQKKIPIIGTTQFNRTVTGVKFDDVDLASLGFSDSIGQDADIVIGLFRNKDMELNKEMYVRTLKVREGEPKSFTLNWDLHAMNFDLISVEDNSAVIEDGEISDDEIDF